LILIMAAQTSRPWKILLVSEDRGLLRGLFRFLTVFGYEVDEAADAQQALAAWEAKRPDFLIIDGPQAFQRSLQRCMSTHVMGETIKVYTFLLTGPEHEVDPAASLAAGVDDFLAKPLDYGELLARLQAGARSVEFERRLRSQAATHPLTGCLTRSALVRRIGAAAADPQNAERWCACVVLDLDFFRRVNYHHGHQAGDELLKSIAQKIRSYCGDGAPLACFGADRFGVFLAGKNESEAAAWAEQLRRELADAEFTWQDAVMRITASFGVSAAKGRSLKAEDFVQTAADALRQAKASGRDCVARYREFDEESKAWNELAAPGRLFERTCARNVMIPCSAAISPKESLPVAVAMFKKTQLAALPVVDAAGKLKGLLLDETVFEDLSEDRVSNGTVGEVMLADPPRFEECDRFESLLDFFTRQSRALAVVTHQGRPTGLVTRQSLATLTSWHTVDSFAPDECGLEGLELLVVPEFSPAGDS
jgi:two-component system, cell cycle response regulator